jgi:hypothetical protein
MLNLAMWHSASALRVRHREACGTRAMSSRSGAGDTFHGAVTEHLTARGWRVGECGACGGTLFSLCDRRCCARSACSGPTGIGGRQTALRAVLWEELWDRARRHFDRRRFALANRSDIQNAVGDTTFVVAGVQVFDLAIHRNQRAPSGRLLVPQPSVRMNYLPRVGRLEGYSTAFVNLCTEQASASIADYVVHLDAWLDYLHTVGLVSENLTLTIPQIAWRVGWGLLWYRDGIELGDSLYVETLGKNARYVLPIVDFSFGLERLVWALNGKAPYYALVGPLPPVSPSHAPVVDAVRTATLMALAGTRPGSRGAGRVMRQLIRHAGFRAIGLDLAPIVRHSHTYWSVFVTPAVSAEDCWTTIHTEWTRSVNLELARRLRRRVRPGHTLVERPSDEFCRALIETGSTFADVLAALHESSGTGSATPAQTTNTRLEVSRVRDGCGR